MKNKDTGQPGLVEGDPKSTSSGRRKPVSQKDVPSYTLDEALRIAQVINDEYALDPTKPLDVAKALRIKPTSSAFKMLCGASIAYGLTDGGYNAKEIKVTPLGQRIVAPTEDGDDTSARREAVLQPRLLSAFLQKYNGKKFPRDEIARNILASLGVARDSAGRALAMILTNAESVGFLKDIKGDKYVDTSPGLAPSRTTPPVPGEETTAAIEEAVEPISVPTVQQERTTENRKVFIAHGKNRKFAEKLKPILELGDLESDLEVERYTGSQPVPDKVMEGMRACGAAIIHIDAERVLLDEEKNEKVVVLNPNVLIEIGASLALYGRRVILLVQKGIELPSNLQGLFRLEYEGKELTAEEAVKLLRMMKDARSRPLPSMSVNSS